MSFTKILEAKVLNDLFGSGSPANIEVGLCTGVTEAGVITGEPVGNGYARVSLTNNTTNFPASAVNGAYTEKKNGGSNYIPTSNRKLGNTITLVCY